MIKNKNFLFDSDSLKNFHKRIFFSIIIFIFFFASASYRIIHISISSYFDNTIKIITKKNINRGNIYDRNGIILAASVHSKSLSAKPYLIKDINNLSYKLEQILNIDKKIIQKKLSSNKKFVWLKRNITPLEQQKIIDLGEINLTFNNETKRLYPFQNSTSHVVGFVNIDQKGQTGIERFYDKSLLSSNDIFLSIDVNLQQSIRSNLIKTVKHYEAESGLALVLDISNGELLSSVSYPDFNPNKKDFNENNLINRVIQSNYEMGSTFKPLTIANGFDYNVINSEMIFDIKKSVKGVRDHDNYKEDGLYNVEKIVVESSNIGTAQIALKIGKKFQKEFLNKLGFFKKIEIESLEAEQPLANPNNWGLHETTRIGFGHSFSITPLHLVKAYATLANEGYIVNPTFVLNKKTKLDKNILFKKKETSDYFLNILNAVITKTKFTGPRVKIDGYMIGGKTGTAELLNPKGGYYKDRNMTSFIGVFPINNPRYIVYTAIEYPKKPKQSKQRMTGAVVNAPLVKNIILEMIKILNIPPNKDHNLLKADIKKLYKSDYAFL